MFKLKKNDFSSLLQLNSDWQNIIDFPFISPTEGSDSYKAQQLLKQWIDFVKHFGVLAINAGTDEKVVKAMRELSINKIREWLASPVLKISKDNAKLMTETIADFLIYTTQFIQQLKPFTQMQETDTPSVLVQTINAQQPEVVAFINRPFTVTEKKLVADHDELLEYPVPRNLLMTISINLFPDPKGPQKDKGLLPLFAERVKAIRATNPALKPVPLFPANTKKERWYEDDKVNSLFKQLSRQNPHVKFNDAVLSTDYADYNTLKPALAQIAEDRIDANQSEAYKQIMIPVNLGTATAEGMHWVLLYLRYSTLAEKPQIIYVDPKGDPIRDNIRYSLKELFPDAEIDYNKTPLQPANDNDNCGPWITAVAPVLIRNETELASQTFKVSKLLESLKGADIETERLRQQNNNPLTPYSSTFLTTLQPVENSINAGNTFSISGFKEKLKQKIRALPTGNINQALRALQVDKSQQAPAPQQTDGWTQIAKLCIEVQQFFEAQDCLVSAFLEFSTAINTLTENEPQALKLGLTAALKTALNHINEAGDIVFKHHLVNVLFDDPATRSLVFTDSVASKITPTMEPDVRGAILLQHLQMAFKGDPVKGSELQNALNFS